MDNDPRFRRRCGTLIALLGSGILMITALAHAGAPPEQQTESGVTYRAGGLGAREADEMRRLSDDYPLALTFTERAEDGRDMFSANVAVRILDASDEVVFETKAPGPLMLVDLEEGHYTVEATLRGAVETREVTLEAGQTQRLTLAWAYQAPDIAPADPTRP